MVPFFNFTPDSEFVESGDCQPWHGSRLCQIRRARDPIPRLVSWLYTRRKSSVLILITITAVTLLCFFAQQRSVLQPPLSQLPALDPRLTLTHLKHNTIYRDKVSSSLILPLSLSFTLSSPQWLPTHKKSQRLIPRSAVSHHPQKMTSLYLRRREQARAHLE